LGAPVVPVYGKLAVVAPRHTDGFAPIVIVGAAVTVTWTVPVPEQPVEEFVTVIVPEYVAAAAPAGTDSVSGLAGNDVVATFVNPAVIAAAFQVIEY
jgi:hypothetical protein